LIYKIATAVGRPRNDKKRISCTRSQPTFANQRLNGSALGEGIDGPLTKMVRVPGLEPDLLL